MIPVEANIVHRGHSVPDTESRNINPLEGGGMLPTGEIARRLHDIVARKGENRVIRDVRFGLSYAGVILDNHHMGLAALLLHELPPGCSVFPDAGTLAGTAASSVLKNLTEGRNPLESALGLATANALLQPFECDDERDSLSIMNLTPDDHVAMVGLFSPMVPKIKTTGAKLSVIERDPTRIAVLEKKEIDRILQECTLAIITATTILNNSLEETLNSLGNPRHVAVLGPSTPLCQEIFQDTPVTHLGGALVRDMDKVMQIISEGGGTRTMRPNLRFVNILLPKTS